MRFSALLNYYLIDWWCNVYFYLFTWWFNPRIWKRGKTGLNQKWCSQIILSIDSYLHTKYLKLLINSLQRSWWTTHAEAYWVQSILGHNWRTRFWDQMLHTIFRVKKDINWFSFLQKPKKIFFVKIYGLFPQNENFSERFG